MDWLRDHWENSSNECLTQKPGSRNYIWFRNPEVRQIKNLRAEPLEMLISSPCNLVYVGKTDTLQPSSGGNSELARRVGNINHQLKQLVGTVMKLHDRWTDVDESFDSPAAFPFTGFEDTQLDELESVRAMRMTVYALEQPACSEADLIRMMPADRLLNRNKGTNGNTGLLYIIFLWLEDAPRVTCTLDLLPCYNATKMTLYWTMVKGGFTTRCFVGNGAELDHLNFDQLLRPKTHVAAELKQLIVSHNKGQLSHEELIELINSIYA